MERETELMSRDGWGMAAAVMAVALGRPSVESGIEVES